MNLRRLGRHWHRLGASDPLWAVLTEKDPRGDAWDVEEFFATGRREVAQLIEELRSLGRELPGGRALDFGCGVGRVSQALGPHFEEIHGVDIAPSMLRLADEYNRERSRVRYHLNSGRDLSMFESGSFDFIYSARVLQHVAPRYAKGYLREFLRLLRPDGLLAFQLPADPLPDPTSSRIRRLRRSVSRALPDPVVNAYRSIRYRRPWMEMHGISVARVVKLVRQEGGAVLDIRVHPAPEWLDARYIVTR